MQTIRVWDLPTRIGHWALALLVIVAVLTGGERGFLYIVHVGCGVSAAMIVLFRLVWGVVGNEHARFADFVVGWRRALDYAGALARFRPPRHLGHNPLGGWMIVALLAIVLLAATTGMIAGDVLGPGTGEAAEDVHEALGSLIQFMILVHVAGVLIDWFLTGDNLIRAMVDGRKPVVEASSDAAAGLGELRDARGGSVWLALVIALPLVLFGGWLYGQIDPASQPTGNESYERD